MYFWERKLVAEKLWRRVFPGVLQTAACALENAPRFRQQKLLLHRPKQNKKLFSARRVNFCGLEKKQVHAFGDTPYLELL